MAFYCWMAGLAAAVWGLPRAAGRVRGWRMDRAFARERAARRPRLLAPDWDAVDAAAGWPPPAALRALYADAARVCREDTVVLQPLGGGTSRAWEVWHYLPMDPDAVHPGPAVRLGAISFARTGLGDLYHVFPGRPGEAPDPSAPWPVFLFHAEAGYAEEVAPSLEAFLSWPVAGGD